jgi:hypothetical protein
MVEIRVAVADATRVSGLMRRLAGLFGRSSLSFDGTRREVTVMAAWEARSVVHVVGAVSEWLVENSAESATLSIGDRSYTMGGSHSVSAG